MQPYRTLHPKRSAGPHLNFESELFELPRPKLNAALQSALYFGVRRAMTFSKEVYP